MSRTAKKSDLVKADLVHFSISLTEAKNLKITKNDLKGIKEIMPNEKYKIRSTTGNRKAETFNGTLIEAIKRKNELTNYSNSSDKKADNDMMFMDASSLYINYCYDREARGDLDINTVYDHIKKINGYIKDFFYKYKLSDIDSKLIETFITSLRKREKKLDPNQTLSEQSISNILITLTAILNFLKRERYIIENPMDYVNNKPKTKKGKKELVYFKIDEAIYAIKCLDKFADIRLKTYMNVIFSLGCRREEASGLRWEDIDFKTGEVDYKYAITSHVPASYVKNRIREKKLKTDNSYRTNYLSDNAINYLKKYYEFKLACGLEINKNDYIFTLLDSNSPVDPNKLSGQWREFKKIHNIKNVDLHRIRHTVANILEKKGIPKKDIAKMLGNTERVLEKYYTHVDVDDLKRMRNTLDNELYDNINYIEIDIVLVSKILNQYPMELLTNDELNKLDLISNETINSDNYLTEISIAKDIILSIDGSLNYFIDDDSNSLNIKIETYKRFNNNDVIKVPKEKDISIKRDILSF